MFWGRAAAYKFFFYLNSEVSEGLKLTWPDAWRLNDLISKRPLHFFLASWWKMPSLLDVGSLYTALLIVPLLTFNYLVKLLYKETQIFRVKPGSPEKNLEPPMGSSAGGRPVWLLQHCHQNITPKCSVAYNFFVFLKDKCVCSKM